MSGQLSQMDPQEVELFPKCQTCTHKAPGIYFCLKDKCENLKKYCCVDCAGAEAIHDHAPKKTQIIINDLVNQYREKWPALRESVEQLAAAATPRFSPNEFLLRYLESVAEHQEERKVAQP